MAKTKKQKKAGPDWHALEGVDVLTQLDSTEEGLSEQQVQNRQQEYGLNRLPKPYRRAAVIRFLLQFHNLLIYVLLATGRVAVLCNDSFLEHKDEKWQVQGDPTEGAILTVGRKMGLDPELEAKKNPRVDSIPFESEYRLMATLHHDHEGHSFICVKGAPPKRFWTCAPTSLMPAAKKI